MKSLTSPWHADANSIHIGLVNNMPDSALEATERQFRTLLSDAADGIAVNLSFFAFPEVQRSESARRRIASSYSFVPELWDSRLDGLIVTGAEPIAANLADEPYWPSLAQLIEWAEYQTYSSVWSCLAAHAAVLQIDGIARRRLADKLFGVFECVNLSDHLLTAGIPAQFRLPHSRWNDLPADALSACGYRILTQLKDGRADTFVKQRKTLFVFFQGHPEYEAASLSLEYRRDIRRFLYKERDVYPAMPHGYFDEESVALSAALRERVLAGRSQPPSVDFLPALRAACTWRAEAVRFYRNWLHYLSEQKSKTLEIRQPQLAYNLSGAGTAAPDLLAPKTDAG